MIPRIKHTEIKKLKVGRELPENLHIKNTLNSSDLVKFENKYYLVVRTAPSHFASPNTITHILSSKDTVNWELDHTIAVGLDVRDQRFLVFKGKLYLHFFKAGFNPLNLEPEHMYVMRKTDKNWSKPKSFYKPGYISFRIKTYNDKIYCSTYHVGSAWSKAFKPNAKWETRLLVSEDAENWEQLSEKPQITSNGVSEAEFEFDKEGNIYGIARLEGWGGHLFSSKKGDLSKWRLVNTGNKYDSPLMFKHNEDFYLISRRNVDGVVNKAPVFFTKKMKWFYNLARYSLTRKRTALFHFDTQKMEINHILDFPSHGDTSAPAIVKTGKDEYLVMFYSSEIKNNRDYPWIIGQLKKTRIYYCTLKFED